MNNREVVKTIRHIFDQYYFLRDECKADSLIRLDYEDCSCRGCVYSYTATLCPMSIVMNIKYLGK